jgi:transcriptional regulator of acetoin/glycerol metabolism
LKEEAWQREGTLTHAKYEAVMKALVWSKWDMSLAAHRLGISLATIYRLVAKYDAGQRPTKLLGATECLLEVAIEEKAWKRAGTIAQAKYEAIMKALVWSKWDVSLAARRLEISRMTIYRLLEQYNVDPVERSITEKQAI